MFAPGLRCLQGQALILCSFWAELYNMNKLMHDNHTRVKAHAQPDEDAGNHSRTCRSSQYRNWLPIDNYEFQAA